jgi:hypothetical protein
MKIPPAPEVDKAALWVIAFQLGVEVELLRAENNIRRGRVIGSDETGFRVEGENWWLWTLQTPDSSERALRPAVIHRKVVGGFRSEAGATVYVLYRTVEDTTRKRGQNLLNNLSQALTGATLPVLPGFSQAWLRN